MPNANADDRLRNAILASGFDAVDIHPGRTAKTRLIRIPGVDGQRFNDVGALATSLRRHGFDASGYGAGVPHTADNYRGAFVVGRFT